MLRPSTLTLLSALLALAAAAPTPTSTTPTRIVASASGEPLSRIFRRDSNAVVTGSAAVSSINNNDGAGSGSTAYHSYSGDGSTGAGWPAKSSWVSFVDMFNNNKNNMFSGCGQYGVADDSGPEIGAIYDGIQAIATQGKVDHRLILAVIMQESSGCVRVPTSYYSVANPGLMQDYQGYYTCNHGNGNVDNPCPSNTIKQMIREGAVGTDTGPGLATNLNQAQQHGCSGAQCFYMAARIYNSGSIPADGNLSEGGSTSSYASDIANRLTGWVG